MTNSVQVSRPECSRWNELRVSYQKLGARSREVHNVRVAFVSSLCVPPSRAVSSCIFDTLPQNPYPQVNESLTSKVIGLGFGTDARGDVKWAFCSGYVYCAFPTWCGKVEEDTFQGRWHSKFQPLKHERFACMQLTKTETETAKSSLYSISSGVRAESLTNYLEDNDLFTLE
jgi:hypothetical protein